MEYIGDESMAAPKLAQARLEPDALASAWAQLHANLQALTEAGLVHADLSVYNLLWWEGRLVLIDLPQAVEFTTNADAWDLLHRDVANVGDWFTRHGLPIDVEEVYADLLTLVRGLVVPGCRGAARQTMPMSGAVFWGERGGPRLRKAPRTRYGTRSAKPQSKNLDNPDETLTFPKGAVSNVRIGDLVVGRLVQEPGWRWSEQVKPIAGTRAASSITSGSGCPVAP